MRKVDEIKWLTDENYHTEALALGAAMIGLDHLAKRFDLIQQLQNLEGSLVWPLGEYRNALAEVLEREAERLLTAEEARIFLASY